MSSHPGQNLTASPYKNKYKQKSLSVILLRGLVLGEKAGYFEEIQINVHLFFQVFPYKDIIGIKRGHK